MDIHAKKKIREKTSMSIPDKSKEKEEKEIISPFERHHIQMKKYRASLSDEKKAEERNKARISMAKLREMKSKEEKEIDRSKARIGMANCYDAKTEEEKMFIKTVKKLRIRKKREEQTEEDHLIQNQKAKKGMQLLKEEGRLRSFQERPSKRYRGTKTSYDTRLSKDENEWDFFRGLSREHSNLLEKKKPNIVSALNEFYRNKRETFLKNFKKEQEANRDEYEKSKNYENRL